MINETLLYNAKVYLSAGKFAEAVLIRGSRIAAVGTDLEMQRLISQDQQKLQTKHADSSSFRQIDCGGPGSLQNLQIQILFGTVSSTARSLMPPCFRKSRTMTF